MLRLHRVEHGDDPMKRAVLACLAALTLCSGCMLLDPDFWLGTDFNCTRDCDSQR